MFGGIFMTHEKNEKDLGDMPARGYGRCQDKGERRYYARGYIHGT